MASYLQKRFFASSKTRHAAESTSTTSTKITETSPFASTVNSAGASTNFVEISQNLDQLLAQIEQDERLEIGRENIGNRLWSICETYKESKFLSPAQSWQCNDFSFSLIMLAARCSEAVYGREATIKQPNDTISSERFHEVVTIPASVDGSIKATLVRLDLDAKTLVISLRGTKATSPVDWLTNANGDAVDASEFLKTGSELKAHKGFLYVARAMAKSIHDTIVSHAASVDNLLFTGHSAGGAVACLLFIHFKLSNAFPSIAIHCITFGSPPALSPLSSTILTTNPNDLFLSFVNQGDPVPRAEKSYVRTLLEVYVKPSPEQGMDFGLAELRSCGTVLVLYDRKADSEDSEIDVVDATKKIESVLYGNVKAHSMQVYLDMLESLGERRRVVHT